MNYESALIVDRPFFGMFTYAGGNQVKHMVEVADILVQMGESADSVIAYVSKKAKHIQQTHAEVRDTAVREEIAFALDRIFAKKGWPVTTSIYSF